MSIHTMETVQKIYECKCPRVFIQRTRIFILEDKEQYHIEIINRFEALENLNDDEDVNRTWENIKDNIQTSAKESLGLHELKQNKL